MAYENPIIFKKLIRRGIKNNSIANNIIKSIIFRKFYIFFIKNNVFCFIKYD